jgi:glycosyltransferase involved in cell wall biosynthesis
MPLLIDANQPPSEVMNHEPRITPAKILSVHNSYQQPGGEDCAFANEALLLEQNGHTVVRYEDSNHRIESGVVSGLAAIWNESSYRKLLSVIRSEKPELVHFHNTFPLISPAGYYAAGKHRIPVVQTLHNYRLLCAGATFFRDGEICEQCIERQSLLPALRHACYRDSRAATAAVITMLAAHRSAGTWQRMVDVFIALTEFSRRKFVAGGLPSKRIAVKPGVLARDPGIGQGRGGYALFVARLCEEKGVRVLADAWRKLSDIPLKVVGEGPLAGIAWPAGVTRLGRQSREDLLTLVKNAYLLVVPSIWYEGAPGVIMEAFACGVPVIASDLGALPELVTRGSTGLLFKSGDSADLAIAVRWAFEHPEDMAPMRVAARHEYESKHSPQENYQMLLGIYQRAMESTRARP